MIASPSPRTMTLDVMPNGGFCKYFLNSVANILASVSRPLSLKRGMRTCSNKANVSEPSLKLKTPLTVLPCSQFCMQSVSSSPSYSLSRSFSQLSQHLTVSVISRPFLCWSAYQSSICLSNGFMLSFTASSSSTGTGSSDSFVVPVDVAMRLFV